MRLSDFQCEFDNELTSGICSMNESSDKYLMNFDVNFAVNDSINMQIITKLLVRQHKKSFKELVQTRMDYCVFLEHTTRNQVFNVLRRILTEHGNFPNFCPFESVGFIFYKKFFYTFEH